MTLTIVIPEVWATILFWYSIVLVGGVALGWIPVYLFLKSQKML